MRGRRPEGGSLAFGASEGDARFFPDIPGTDAAVSRGGGRGRSERSSSLPLRIRRARALRVADEDPWGLRAFAGLPCDAEAGIPPGEAGSTWVPAFSLKGALAAGRGFAFAIVGKNEAESLILAQNERWRRA
jgi:hypothetical protein